MTTYLSRQPRGSAALTRRRCRRVELVRSDCYASRTVRDEAQRIVDEAALCQTFFDAVPKFPSW